MQEPRLPQNQSVCLRGFHTAGQLCAVPNRRALICFRLVPFLIVAALTATLCPADGFTAAPGSSLHSPAPPTIVFMTDFGSVHDAVPICKGVIYGIAPQARI